MNRKRKKSLPKVRIDSAGDEGGGSGCGRLRRHTSEPCSGDEREEFEMQEDIVRSRERLAGGNSLDIPEDHKVFFFYLWNDSIDDKNGREESCRLKGNTGK